ncbi:DUF397 domain-containing protein [Actinomadura sp. BRA 177]|uniref:DUF397 domain-containing protein n=1 Tax=Actinomadura sp. BRA 177 TaxID=2745202 RepID=UPI00159610C8|nr:DUF397 domain-containing protein [Actinomadura sp. BRA 177]NVI88516.1 DUF397 domain-containing protein [Actinomadura sp. BRA 177]
MTAPDQSAVTWRKSSRSDHHGGNCIEVAEFAAMIAVRDSKDPDGTKLSFGAAEWRVFTRHIQEERYG